MIGLDTNVLVRYIAQDNPGQSRRATELIEKKLSKENPGFISLIVLCEVVWVLKRAYGLSRTDIAKALELILFASELEVERPDLAWKVLKEYRSSSYDFSDLLIAELAVSFKCSHVYTLDKKAANHILFKSL